MARVTWYARRARAMSTGELAARATRSVRHLADDLSFRLARPLWRRAWEPRLDRIVTGPEPAEPLGFLRADRAAEVAARFPSAASRTAAAADDVLAGAFALFGETSRLERPLDFAFDPRSGRRWPARHGKRLDYRAGGDPKWAWELNRLQHLPLLVSAWFLTGRETYADRAAGDLRDWLAATQVGRGIAWTSGFEAGLRAASIALCFDGLRGTSFLDEQLRAATLRSLWQHARFIGRDPSTHSSANNHRIGELAGLGAIGLLAPELREAAAWRDEAARALETEAGRQILPDGTSAEQSFAYHLSVLEHLLFVLALVDARAGRRPPAIVAALTRSADALWAQLAPGEPQPTYGDSDDGRVTRLGDEAPADARRVAAWLAAALGHDGAAALATPDPTAVWLFGEEGARLAEHAPRRADPDDVVLPDSGLVVFRRGDTRVTMDAGPLGQGALAAHGHADALQVTISDGEGELVVDPGVGSYYRHPEFRDAFRGTGFHATVLVDEVDQSRSGGPFLWTRHARARLRAVDLEAGFAVAEHDGYRRLPDPVEHRRAVLVLEDGVALVVDRLRGAKAHRFSQRWPLAPELEAVAAGAAEIRVMQGSEARLLLVLASSAPATIRLARGEREHPLGWSSSGLERVEPAWICLWEPAPVPEVVLAALLHPVSGGWPSPGLELDATGPAPIVSLWTAAARRSYVVHPDRMEPFREAGVDSGMASRPA